MEATIACRPQACAICFFIRGTVAIWFGLSVLLPQSGIVDRAACICAEVGVRLASFLGGWWRHCLFLVTVTVTGMGIYKSL